MEKFFIAWKFNRKNSRWNKNWWNKLVTEISFDLDKINLTFSKSFCLLPAYFIWCSFFTLISLMNCRLKRRDEEKSWLLLEEIWSFRQIHLDCKVLWWVKMASKIKQGSQHHSYFKKCMSSHLCKYHSRILNI